MKVAFIDCEDDAGPFRLPVFKRRNARRGSGLRHR